MKVSVTSNFTNSDLDSIHLFRIGEVLLKRHRIRRVTSITDHHDLKNNNKEDLTSLAYPILDTNETMECYLLAFNSNFMDHSKVLLL
jgi:hypothetical protein